MPIILVHYLLITQNMVFRTPCSINKLVYKDQNCKNSFYSLLLFNLRKTLGIGRRLRFLSAKLEKTQTFR